MGLGNGDGDADDRHVQAPAGLAGSRPTASRTPRIVALAHDGGPPPGGDDPVEFGRVVSSSAMRVWKGSTAASTTSATSPSAPVPLAREP